MQISIDSGKEPTQETMIKLTGILVNKNDSYTKSKLKWAKDKKKLDLLKKKLSKREEKMKSKFGELEHAISVIRTNDMICEMIHPLMKRHRDIQIDKIKENL